MLMDWLGKLKLKENNEEDFRKDNSKERMILVKDDKLMKMNLKQMLVMRDDKKNEEVCNVKALIKTTVTEKQETVMEMEDVIWIFDLDLGILKKRMDRIEIDGGFGIGEKKGTADLGTEKSNSVDIIWKAMRASRQRNADEMGYWGFCKDCLFIKIGFVLKFKALRF